MSTTKTKRKADLCPCCRKRRKKVCGRCSACYMTVRRAIKAGEITKEQAIEEGLIDPPQRAARSSAMRKRIEALQKAK